MPALSIPEADLEERIQVQVVNLGHEGKHQQGRGKLKMVGHQAKWFSCVMSLLFPFERRRS